MRLQDTHPDDLEEPRCLEDHRLYVGMEGQLLDGFHAVSLLLEHERRLHVADESVHEHDDHEEPETEEQPLRVAREVERRALEEHRRHEGPEDPRQPLTTLPDAHLGVGQL